MVGPAPRLPNGGGAAGRAEIVRYETEQVEIEAECPASFRTGILLLLASLIMGSAGLLGLGRVGSRAR